MRSGPQVGRGLAFRDMIAQRVMTVTDSQANRSDYDRMVFLPEIRTDVGRVNVGQVFSVRYQDREFFVTALHLFGPAGGLSRRIPPDDLTAVVNSVQLHDPATDEIVHQDLIPVDTGFGTPLNPAAEVIDASKDIAVFLSNDSPALDAFEIARESPSEGDTLYVIGYQRFVETSRVRRFRLSLVDADESHWVLKYHEPVDVSGMSGAPITNERGSLVSMLVGGLKTERGVEHGLGVPYNGVLNYFNHIIGLIR
jgi:trypsin-like peptidase